MKKSKTASIILIFVLCICIAIAIVGSIMIPKDITINADSKYDIKTIYSMNDGKFFISTKQGEVICLDKNGETLNTTNIQEFVENKTGLKDSFVDNFYGESKDGYFYLSVCFQYDSSKSVLIRALLQDDKFIIDDEDYILISGNVKRIIAVDEGVDKGLYMIMENKYNGSNVYLASGFVLIKIDTENFENNYNDTLHTYNYNSFVRLYEANAVEGSNRVDLDVIKTTDPLKLFSYYDGIIYVGTENLLISLAPSYLDENFDKFFLGKTGAEIEACNTFGVIEVNKILSKPSLQVNASKFSKEKYNCASIELRGGVLIDGTLYRYGVDENVFTIDVAYMQDEDFSVGDYIEGDLLKDYKTEGAPYTKGRSPIFYSRKTNNGYLLYNSGMSSISLASTVSKIDFTNNTIESCSVNSTILDLYEIDEGVIAYQRAGGKDKESNVVIIAEYDKILSSGIFNALKIVGIVLSIVSFILLIVMMLCWLKEGFSFKAQKVGKKVLRDWKIYFAMIPSIVLLFTFCYYEAISSIIRSFFEYRPSGEGFVINYIGIDNFRKIFTSPEVAGLFKNMAIYLGFDLVVAICPPLIFAFFLTVMMSKKFSGVLRTLLFLPGVIPGVAGMLVWKMGIYGDGGIVFNIFGKNLLNFPETAKWAMLMMGFPFCGAYLIFYGAMMNVPDSYYEAAELEGIGIWGRLFKIDIPLIAPQVKYIFITSFIHSVQNFQRIDIMDKGAANATGTPVYTMYQLISDNKNYGMASAYATIVFVLLFFATIISFRSKTKKSEAASL